MRCATCGERLGVADARCPTCGAAQGRGLIERITGEPTPVGLHQCPRCGYRGQGISYFSRPGHVGLLVGVSLFTYGIGGMVYWLARRKHRICPNCGLGWDYAGGTLGPAPGSGGEFRSLVPTTLPSSGTKRRVLGSGLILLASFLIMMGVLELEAALLVVGSVMGAAGSGTFFWGWKALQERRQAINTGLQRQILQLAEHRGGSLTVTEVSASLDVSLPAAEKLLIGMDDGFRVRSEITDDGIIVYEFPEVLHRRQLEGGSQT